jgi:predicted RND superfamily exporter protein
MPPASAAAPASAPPAPAATTSSPQPAAATAPLFRSAACTFYSGRAERSRTLPGGHYNEGRAVNVRSIVDGLSNWLFGHRRMMLAVFAAITVGLAISATQLRVDAGFKKMVPLAHPYMKTFVDYESTFGGANRVVVALLRKNGTIFDAAYMKALKSATDDVFFVPGVDRATVQSLFTPNTRFIEVVEEGFAGGNVIPATFQGSAADLTTVALNVQKAGLVGRLVSNDLRGALIRADLLDVDPQTGKRLAYAAVAQKLEAIRDKYQSPDMDVAIIGFAKAVGDITDGARGVLLFFLVAFIITAILLRWYSHSTLLTGAALACAMLPVLWLLGALPLVGFGIDPLSVLVPFLIFSIGCSHAVQMTNTWRLEVQAGANALEAARNAFAKLFVPGALALLTNALGFLAIMFIKIDIVRELGLTATLGVSLMIVTNKMVLPILLSYLPTAKIAAAGTGEAAAGVEGRHKIWHALSHCADRRVAIWIIAASLLLAGFGWWKARDLTVGDLGQGVPELRDDSRYNKDSATITRNFAIGVDVLAIVAQSQGTKGACTEFDIVDAIDEFEWAMKNVEGVHSTISLPGLAKIVNAGWNEGAVKWRVLARAPEVLAQSVTPIDTSDGAPQLRLLGDADPAVHERPPGRHARARGAGGEGLQHRIREAPGGEAARVQARQRQRGRDGGDQRSGGGGEDRGACRALHGIGADVPADVPFDCRHAVHHPAAGARVTAQQRADGDAGDRHQRCRPCR